MDARPGWLPRPRTRVEWGLACASLALLYFLAARLGLSMSVVNASASPVWPPTGVAIAALLVLGLRAWPGVTVGAYLANALTTGWGWPSLAIAGGNTLEALAAAWLVTRFAGGLDCLRRPRGVLAFAVLAGLVATAVSASLGVATLVASGNAPAAAARAIWTTWWLGDATGALLFGLPLIALAQARPTTRDLPESILGLGLVAALGGVVFSPLLGDSVLLLLIPLVALGWTAWRLGSLVAACAALVLATVAILGTLGRYGPLVTTDPNTELLVLQAYLGTASLTALILAAFRHARPATAPTFEQLQRRNYVAAVVGTVGVALLGTLVVAGWFLDIDQLKAPIQGTGSMKANTAIGLVAASVLLLTTRQARRPGLPGGLAAGLMLALGLATLAQYLLGVNLGIDELLVRDDLATISTSSPGRMSVFTALGLSLLASSVLARPLPRYGARLADALSLLTCGIGLLALTGQAYGATLFASTTQVALHTAAALFVAGLASILLHQRGALAAVFASPDVDGRLARMLPLGILGIPILLGLAGLQLENEGRLTEAQSALLSVFATMVLVVVVALATVSQAREALQQRAQAEAALRQAVQRTNEAERVTHRGSWDWDVTTNRAVWSEGMYRLFGVDPATFQNSNENFLAMVLPQDRDRMGQAMAAALANPGTFYQEYRLRRPDGAIRYLQGEGSVVVDDAGKPRMLYGVVQDLTEQKLAEVELRRAQERFERVFHASPAAIALTRRDGRFIDANEAFASLVGRDRATLLSGTLKAEELWADGPQRDVLLAALEKGGSVREFEMVLRRPDGSERIGLAGVEYLDVGGETTILSTLQDITERKQQQQRRETRIANEAELDRLRRTDQFRTDFINSTAHELATPLTPLVLNLAALKHDPGLSERQAAALQAMERSITRLRRIIDDLVGAADLQARAITLDRRRLNITRELRAAVAAHQRPADRAGIALPDPVDSGLSVSADPARLQLVLGHLLGNALKFTPPGGTVTLASRRDVDMVRIEVSDTGIGLTRQQIDALWKPFGQAHDKSQRTDSGSGLGLYVTKGVVDLHGGEVGCVSAGPGKGATFWFTLPMATGHVDPLATRTEAEPPKRADLNPGVGEAAA